MKLEIAPGTDIREKFQELGGATGFVHRTGDSEQTLEFPERLGRGRVELFALRPGLDFTVMDCLLTEPLTLKAASDYPMIELGFCLSGGSRGSIAGLGEEVFTKPGNSVLSLWPEMTDGEARYEVGKRILSAEIRVSRQFLTAMLGGEEKLRTAILPDFPDLPDGHTWKPRIWLRDTDWATKTALAQLLDCPYPEPARRVYREGKILELLAFQLSGTRSKESNNTVSVVLRPKELERVREAAEVLVANMQEPPSLLQLARRVALNDYKLKVGFKQVFGTTAFGYLHEQRMDFSRDLLESGDMNVGEVALAVGYSNQSHFAAAFKRKFGVNPGSISRRSLYKTA